MDGRFTTWRRQWVWRAAEAEAHGRVDAAWRALLHFHRLSEGGVRDHVYAHLVLLGFALRHRRVRDVGVQLVALVTAAPTTLLRPPVAELPVPGSLTALLAAVPPCPRGEEGGSGRRATG